MSTKESMDSRLWRKSLEALFDMPTSVIIIRGSPKTGKTDFALFLVENLLQLRIIKKWATNIYVKNAGRSYTFMNNIPSLKAWITYDKTSKLFIYDEAITSTPSRRPLARLNVAWFTVLPQLSKGKCKLIVVTQTEKYSDSMFNNPVFLRAIISKSSKKYAQIESPLLEEGIVPISRIPKTKFKFDPYAIQTFQAEGDYSKIKNNRRRILLEWAHHDKMSFRSLGLQEDPPLQSVQIQRLIKEEIRQILTKSASH